MNAESKTVGSRTLCTDASTMSWQRGFHISVLLSSNWSSSWVKPALQQSCQPMFHVASPEPSQPFPAPVLTESYRNPFSPESGTPDVGLNQGDCPLRNPHPHLGMSYFHRLFFEKRNPVLLSMPGFFCLLVFLSTSLLHSSHTQTCMQGLMV